MPPVPVPTGKSVVPQLPTSALRMVMARSVWNELTKFATGEELNARAFAADFAEGKK